MKKQAPVPPWARQSVIAMPVYAGTADAAPDRVTDLHVSVDVPFLAKGIVIWGATKETMILDIKAGNAVAFAAAWNPIPARYFEAPAGRSFEDLIALAEAGDLADALHVRQQLEASYEMQTGTYFRIQMQGPFESVCAWGLTQAYDIPPVKADIVQLDNGRFRGMLHRSSLSGTRPTVEVEAPTSADAAALLGTLQVPRGW